MRTVKQGSLPPHPEQWRPVREGVREIEHPSHAVPLIEVVYKHLPTGRLFACEPASESLRALRRGRHAEFEQVLGHPADNPSAHGSTAYEREKQQ